MNRRAFLAGTIPVATTVAGLTIGERAMALSPERRTILDAELKRLEIEHHLECLAALLADPAPGEAKLTLLMLKRGEGGPKAYLQAEGASGGRFDKQFDSLEWRQF